MPEPDTWPRSDWIAGYKAACRIEVAPDTASAAFRCGHGYAMGLMFLGRELRESDAERSYELVTGGDPDALHAEAEKDYFNE